MIDSVLGPYRILAKLGEGGMGRSTARATRVSIATWPLKVLPDAFAADPDRLARFAREAQTLAALNHPNIAQSYAAPDPLILFRIFNYPADPTAP